MLYIMRHGRTDWNDLRKLQGRTDIPLNEKGIRMAEEAREKYRDISFDICYCSPLIRAKRTAEIFLEGRDIPLIPDDRLMEMSFGIYEGMENCMEKKHLAISLFFLDPENYPGVEGGETFEDLFSRTASFLKEIEQEYREKNVLIVGHGAMDLSIIAQIKGKELKDFWKDPMGNCELIRLV